MASAFHLLAREAVVAPFFDSALALGNVKLARIFRDIDFQLLWQRLRNWVKIG